MVREIIKGFIIMEIKKNVVDDEGITNVYVKLIHGVVIYVDVPIITFFILRYCRMMPNDAGGIVSVISVYGPFLITLKRSSCRSL